jgi:uncharacterized alkaline shock family protein YloU
MIAQSDPVTGTAIMHAVLKGFSKKNLSKGVKVNVGEGSSTIDLFIVVEYGVKIPEVSKLVQENVKKTVETMTGLVVSAVNIHVQNVVIPKLDEIRDYLTANYGISPIITSDYVYAALKCDFIVSSRDIEVEKPVWYINNLFTPMGNKTCIVNDISFAVPWKTENLEYSFELLGAILGQMQEKDVETALKYNGIYLDKIKFNGEVKTQ